VNRWPVVQSPKPLPTNTPRLSRRPIILLYWLQFSQDGTEENTNKIPSTDQCL